MTFDIEQERQRMKEIEAELKIFHALEDEFANNFAMFCNKESADYPDTWLEVLQEYCWEHDEWEKTFPADEEYDSLKEYKRTLAFAKKFIFDKVSEDFLEYKAAYYSNISNMIETFLSIRDDKKTFVC